MRRSDASRCRASAASAWAAVPRCAACHGARCSVRNRSYVQMTAGVSYGTQHLVELRICDRPGGRVWRSPALFITRILLSEQLATDLHRPLRHYDSITAASKTPVSAEVPDCCVTPHAVMASQDLPRDYAHGVVLSTMARGPSCWSSPAAASGGHWRCARRPPATRPPAAVPTGSPALRRHTQLTAVRPADTGHSEAHAAQHSDVLNAQ